MDFVVFYSIEFTGLHVDSTWTPYGLNDIFNTLPFPTESTWSPVESMWTPCGLHMD